ncbi:MAG: hypothetical protein LBE89_07460 [Helicobacteraceae bacterium]|jgi:hypothetical protein|nr:hypothetical protein [Helicobacteraceae bacterium]
MWRLIFSLCALALSMNAGGLTLGIRYGDMIQKGEYGGEKTDSKNQWGPGGMIGYDIESIRVVIAYDMFEGSKQGDAQMLTLGVHMVEQTSQYIGGFLGMDLGRLNYRHTSSLHTSSDSLNIYGIAGGLILLDERFPGAQMEIGLRYHRTFGKDNDDLDLDSYLNAYVCLSLSLF